MSFRFKHIIVIFLTVWFAVQTAAIAHENSAEHIGQEAHFCLAHSAQFDDFTFDSHSQVCLELSIQDKKQESYYQSYISQKFSLLQFGRAPPQIS